MTRQSSLRRRGLFYFRVKQFFAKTHSHYVRRTSIEDFHLRRWMSKKFDRPTRRALHPLPQEARFSRRRFWWDSIREGGFFLCKFRRLRGHASSATDRRTDIDRTNRKQLSRQSGRRATHKIPQSHGFSIDRTMVQSSVATRIEDVKCP